jgi:hypothetical protein
MSAVACAARRYAFRPDPLPDGVLVPSEPGAEIPVRPPDWEQALGLLRQMNNLRDLEGNRVSSRIQVDGFEPWWFVQDRLYRFYLLPFTRYREFLRACDGCPEVCVENTPADLARLARVLSGRAGFPRFAPLGQGGMQQPAGKAGPRVWAGRGSLAIMTCASLLLFRLLRRDTLLYVIDQLSPGLDHDFRLSPLYDELRARGYRVAEYAHTLSPRLAIRNSLRRRRPVAFVESFGELLDSGGPLEVISLSLPPSSGVPDLESALQLALVPQVLSWCHQSAARYRRIRRALGIHGARRAIIFDDNRHNHELVAACKGLSIGVLGFQHGILNRFHAGLMAYGFAGARRHDFDRYGLWGPTFVERILRDSDLFEAGRLFVAGPVRPPASGREREPADRPKAVAVRQLLLVSEPLARKHEVNAYLRPLLEDPRYRLHLKLRPGERWEALQEYGLSMQQAEIVQTSTVYEAFEHAHVVIGTYSSVLYEALLALRPIVWLKTSMAYGAELVQEGLAEEATSPEEIRRAIERAASLSIEELERRRDRVWSNVRGSGVVTLLNRAERDLWDPPQGQRRA